MTENTTRREKRFLESLGFLKYSDLEVGGGLHFLPPHGEVWYRPDPVYGEIRFREKNRCFEWLDIGLGYPRPFIFCLRQRRIETAYEAVRRGMERVLDSRGYPTEGELRYLKTRGYVMTRSDSGVRYWRHPLLGFCISSLNDWMWRGLSVHYSSLYELLLDRQLYTGGLDAR